MTVTELLTASVGAHLRYRAAHDAKDPAGMYAALTDASQLRQQAHAADPMHADRAWHGYETRYPHDALTAFYREQLS